MANQTWCPCFVKVNILAAEHKTDKSYPSLMHELHKLKSKAKKLQIYPYA